ncbi:S41 family peptidase [Mariniblastus fucicola]|uniref:Putative CtpA-like serine protease n=1 Tax=Mariniblastus fucicola TaxID=980251 RepID=A0A5B9PQ67_9BACT|nr:S41 family peptidase [Mariniblastus fucicola]QEG24611.1 putative CtpA-like serine protease [Mariniblastus fucicola]
MIRSLLNALVILLTSALLLPAVSASAQQTANASDAKTTLTEGRSLEKSGRWGDALGLYQQFLRKHPVDKNIQRRRSVARLHFDLERRYSDSSFIRTVKTSETSAALTVYAEVLAKIQSYYVDTPNWSELASFGLTSLEIAMMDPEFRDANLPGISETQIRDAILQTREDLKSATVSSRHDAYLVAHKTAKSLEQRIGLRGQATVYEFVCGAISALDPYSGFMSASQYGESMSQIEGNFVGLGVELRTNEDHLHIVSVIEGGSADVHGLTKDDHIIAVDGNSVEQIGSEKAADMLRGPENSFVELTVARNQSHQKMRLERRRIEIPSVEDVSIVDREAGVGYLRLTNFQKTTPRDFDAALWKLHRQGMRSLIVDVRGNPGGLLQASVDIADKFVNDGVIVSTRGRNPMEDYTHRANTASTWRMPLIVLIDGNSASASEIFAAAIRDHKRGIIVGEKSYGKGSVQGIFPLNISGGGVRLTTAKFYSPHGNAISEVGVKADVLVHEVAKSSSLANSDQEDAGMRLGILEAKKLVMKSENVHQPVAGKTLSTNVSFSGR